jgi:ribosomal protein S18 acetylase RimI-like enzyme
MNIRKMTIEDLEQIISIGSNETSFAATLDSGSFWTNEQLRASITTDQDVLLVGEENRQIVGFAITLLHKPTGKASFENLWVHPDHRKREFGQKLIKRTLEELKNRDCKFVCSIIRDDNKSISNLLEKMGFQKGYKFYWMHTTL